MRIVLDPFKATEEDKLPFLWLWGIAFAIGTTAVVLFNVEGLAGFAGVMVIAILAVVGLFGGMLVGWFFWGLFFEPQIEAKKKGKGAV